MPRGLVLSSTGSCLYHRIPEEPLGPEQTGGSSLPAPHYCLWGSQRKADARAQLIPASEPWLPTCKWAPTGSDVAGVSPVSMDPGEAQPVGDATGFAIL